MSQYTGCCNLEDNKQNRHCCLTACHREKFVAIPVTKGARIGPMQEKSFIFVSVSSLRNKKKKINWKKFIVWGSAGICWKKLIFAFGGGG
jgi:hypothetical protein